MSQVEAPVISVHERLVRAKTASREIGALSGAQKTSVLNAIADALIDARGIQWSGDRASRSSPS
jgi:hypothetical protein